MRREITEGNELGIDRGSDMRMRKEKDRGTGD